MSEINDSSQLFARIAEGDKAAFDTFFRHYYPKLVRFAGLFICDEPQAEDVVADVLTNLLIHRQRVFALPHVEAYLYASVKNQARSYLKKQGRTHSFLQSRRLRPDLSVVPDPYELLVGQELHTLISKLIQELPPKRRMVFQLLREEKLSYRQVADLMEISERTVEVHLRLAIKALRLGLEQYLSRPETPRIAPSLTHVLTPFFLSSLARELISSVFLVGWNS